MNCLEFRSLRLGEALPYNTMYFMVILAIVESFLFIPFLCVYLFNGFKGVNLSQKVGGGGRPPNSEG
jgi:hypothetical protein